MKRKTILVLLCLLTVVVSCYKGEITDLQNRVDKIENDKIATLQEQIASVSTSVLDLQKMDTQLKSYISVLQDQADVLEETMVAVDKKIDEVKSELEADMDEQNVLVMSEIEAYRTLLQTQLDAVNKAVASLQEKDGVLEKEILGIKAYVEDEVKNAKDWVSGTFTTLQMYEELSDVVAGIKAEINSLNEYVENINSVVRSLVEEELSDAVSGFEESLREDMEAVVSDCNQAMQTAAEEIKSAYEAEIKTAIAVSETNMKSWVNTQLDKYYTATQIDSKLTSLKSSFETQLDKQKTYLLGLIESLEQAMTSRIDANQASVDELSDNLSSLSGEVVMIAENVIGNTESISSNAQAINANAKLISENAMEIDANKKLIDENNALINANHTEIQNLKERLSTAEGTIVSNVEKIARNAEDIAANASLIAQNAAAISNNGAAVAENAKAIEDLKAQLLETKEEITAAYKAAISTAITNLDGKLSGQIATEVETLNSRIDTEIATINDAIEALAARVAACEKDIKSIKTSIYNMQIEISDIQDQIEAILARVQSVEFIPRYSDGKATMYYTNNGKITPGSATFDFELQPASTAAELADVWEDALSMKAVHTQTRAAVDFVDMEIVSVTAVDGVLTVVASGDVLSDDFYLGRISANACLVISDGNNEIASDYINMVPWTTDVIYVPDAAFKAYLLANFDTDADGEISEDEAMDIESVDLSGLTDKVATLSGVEYMKNLKTLNAAYHSLTSLDLSHNNALTAVVVNNNKLKTLDLSGCTAIVSLECSGNKLTTLDVSEAVGLTDLACSNNDLGALNLTNNKALVNLQCSGNNIATLDLKNLLALETLYCRSNSLSVLDLSKNTALRELDCSSNNLVTLNLNKNTELESVYCRSNSLTSLYLNNCGKITMLDCSKNALTTLNLNGCVAVETLNCSDNSIVTLDLSALTALETLDCSGNDFATLDVSANTALTSVDCSDNATLAKLWVKDAAHQEQMTITKDDDTNIFFNAGGLVFSDKALETYMLANYDDDYDGVISIAEADNVTTVNCANKGIIDLTGLESCTNLVYLNCSGNNIKVVDCHTLVNLESLSCYGNPVEVLDLSNCAKLQSLFMQNVSTNAVSGTSVSVTGYDQASSLKMSLANTPFTTLSVTGSSVLTELDVNANDNVQVFNGYDNTVLTSLTLSPYFKEVHAYGCSVLEGTDVSDIAGLTVLDLHSCNLQTLNVDSNPELVTFDCSSNQLTALNVDNNTGLVSLKVNANSLTQFKVANNTALETLDVSDNKLIAINVRSNTALKDLRMSNNTDITALNLKNNIALETLYADGLSISEINLVGNDALAIVSLRNNNLLTQSYIDNEVSTDLLICASHNFDVVNSSGTLITTLYERIGTVLYFSGSEIGGVICGPNIVVSLYETSASWSDANHWCSSYGDGMWYLPSLDELSLILSNKSELNKTLSKVGAIKFGASKYWSSTERSGYVPYVLDFGTGRSDYGIMSSSKYQVRAVRDF